MKKENTLSIRVNEQNLFHHLWNNNGTWWCNYTVHYSDNTSERVRCSLKTHDSELAKKLRDFLLNGGDPKQINRRAAYPRQLLPFDLPKLPDSDPLFTRGFVIGGRGFNRSRDKRVSTHVQ